jgi:hypothetical protein
MPFAEFFVNLMKNLSCKKNFNDGFYFEISLAKKT